MCDGTKNTREAFTASDTCWDSCRGPFGAWLTYIIIDHVLFSAMQHGTEGIGGVLYWYSGL